MWIMSTRGFFSVVQDRNLDTCVLVRARSERHIRALADLIDAEPWAEQHSDYEWRLRCTRAEWVKAVSLMALDIDYPNFKNAVKDPSYKATLYRLWSVLLRLESAPPGRRRRRKAKAGRR